MITSLIHKTVAFALRLANNFSYTKYWKMKAALLCSIIAVALSFPDYDLLIFDKANPLAKAVHEALQHQLSHPFTPIPDKYLHLANGHLDKRAFRITVPVIASLLNIRLVGCLVLQHITGVAFYYFLITALCNCCKDRTIALFTALGFATTFVGVWSFYDTICFDGIAYFFLILAMSSQNAWWIGSSVLLASFTDERALIASSFVFLWWLMQDGKDATISKQIPVLGRRSVSVIVAWSLYMVTRYTLQRVFGLHTGTQAIGLSVLRENFPYLPFGLISSVEAFWLIIGAAIVVLVYRKQFVLCLLFTGAIVVTQLVGFLVNDVTRSVGYVFPAVLIAIFILQQVEAKETVRKLMLLTSVLCLLYPTTYVMMDIYWMSPVFPKILKYINP